MTIAFALTGIFVNPIPSRDITISPNNLLAVDHDGFITYFGDAGSEKAIHVLEQCKEEGAEVISLGEHGFVLPGMVDTHIHAPQYMNAGTALDKPLMEWLEHYTFKSEARIDADPNGLGQRVYAKLVQRMIQGGTTLASVFGTLSVEANLTLAKAFQEGGIRGQIGKVSMDLNGIDTYIETTSDSLSRNSAFISSLHAMLEPLPPHQRLVEAVITPRFVPTCSEALLKGLAELAKETGVRIQSHMCEAEDQVEWSKSMWAGKADVEVLDTLGLLTDKSLMAHCTHATDADLSLLAKRGTSVAHCPLSNIYFSAEKAFPLREAWNADVKVGVGSDISGGYQVHLDNAMRSAVQVARVRAGTEGEKSLALTWRESIYLATLGGADAMGMGGTVGSFEVGKAFDAQWIEVQSEASTIDLFDDLSLEDLVEKWWSIGTPANRVGVWVQGKRLR